MPARVRLADLLAGLSIAIDLGFGLPPESAIRRCLVGTRLARAHGLADAEVRDSFFASLLLHVGCPGFSHETAALFGNEHARPDGSQGSEAPARSPSGCGCSPWPAIRSGSRTGLRSVTCAGPCGRGRSRGSRPRSARDADASASKCLPDVLSRARLKVDLWSTLLRSHRRRSSSLRRVRSRTAS